MTPSQGDIFVVSFAGAVEAKRRPAVIVSSNAYHMHRPDVVLGIITSNIEAANSPTDCVLLDWENAGLRVPSAFRAYFVTIPSKQLVAKIGHLSDRDWSAINKSLGIVFENDL